MSSESYWRFIGAIGSFHSPHGRHTLMVCKCAFRVIRSSITGWRYCTTLSRARFLRQRSDRTSRGTRRRNAAQLRPTTACNGGDVPTRNPYDVKRTGKFWRFPNGSPRNRLEENAIRPAVIGAHEMDSHLRKVPPSRQPFRPPQITRTAL